jgi:hypothetical protein
LCKKRQYNQSIYKNKEIKTKKTTPKTNKQKTKQTNKQTKKQSKETKNK